MADSGWFDRLRGFGLDIGAGDDPLVLPGGLDHGYVRTWDRGDGDAAHLPGILDGTLGFIYSSHCLEHLPDVPAALARWGRCLQPGAPMLLFVPDYCLYEHLTWPSRYNPDHKATFSLTLTRAKVGRNNHWASPELQHAIHAAGLILDGAALMDDGYDYNAGDIDQTLGGAVAHIRIECRRRPSDP